MSTKTNGAGTDGSGFSEQERQAIKERAKELKTQASRGRSEKKAAADELDVLDKIQKMSDTDRALAERIHAIVTTNAPDLAPKLFYGQPAYARNGKVVCFFRSGDVDKERYSTLGFSAEAPLDDDSGLWPTSYAVSELGPEAEKVITALVKRLGAADG